MFGTEVGPKVNACCRPTSIPNEGYLRDIAEGEVRNTRSLQQGRGVLLVLTGDSHVTSSSRASAMPDACDVTSRVDRSRDGATPRAQGWARRYL
jgi:hypothetical protein